MHACVSGARAFASAANIRSYVLGSAPSRAAGGLSSDLVGKIKRAFYYYYASLAAQHQHHYQQQQHLFTS